MSPHERCPHCGQAMTETRCGVHLSPLKRRIFDAVERAGPAGISSELLLEAYGLPVTQRTLKAHVWQINEVLLNTGYCIRGRGYGGHGYRLVHQAHDRHGSETSEQRAVSGIE